MLKKTLITAGLLATASFASATPFVTDSLVTGNLMTTLKVTVEYGDGSTSSAKWEVISDTLLNTGDPILDQNGLSGGALTSDWTLVQSGPTLGGFDDDGKAYGLWTLTNLGDTPIVKFTLDGLTDSGVNVAFDINPDIEGTPGSETGQEFVSASITDHVYYDLVDPTYNDLYWNLEVNIQNHLTTQQSLIFFADTDLVNANAPAMLGLVFGGMLLFTRKFKK